MATVHIIQGCLEGLGTNGYGHLSFQIYPASSHVYDRFCLTLLMAKQSCSAAGIRTTKNQATLFTSPAQEFTDVAPYYKLLDDYNPSNVQTSWEIRYQDDITYWDKHQTKNSGLVVCMYLMDVQCVQEVSLSLWGWLMGLGLSFRASPIILKICKQSYLDKNLEH